MNTIAAKYQLTTYKCHYCGCCLVPKTKQTRRLKIAPGNLRTIDHRIPASRGGLNRLSNYVECCHKCNQDKAQLTENEYFIIVRYRQIVTFVRVAVGILIGFGIKICLFVRNSA